MNILVRLPTEWHQRLRDDATKNEMSLAALMRAIVAVYLGEVQPEEVKALHDVRETSEVPAR